MIELKKVAISCDFMPVVLEAVLKTRLVSPYHGIFIWPLAAV
jgi:hypothetical protein